jgi:hypothetical protein
LRNTPLNNPNPNLAWQSMNYLLTLRRSLRGSVIADGAIMVAAIGAMVAVNHEWLFTVPGGIDSWIYVGYFLHYDHSNFLVGEKKIARLPWVLLGFITYKLTSPFVASYLLHGGLLLAGAFVFYRIADRFFGRQAAVLVALTYLTTQSMHGSGGWDYNTTLTPFVYFIAFSAFDKALLNSRAPFISFIKPGVLLAIVVHTNILILVVAPALLIQAIFRIWSGEPELRRFRWLALAAIGMVTGAVAITVCLGLINVAFGRQFFFPGQLLQLSAGFLVHPGEEVSWWLSWSDPWWITDIQTALPEAVVILILVFSISALMRWLVNGVGMKPLFVAVYLEYLASLAFGMLMQSMGQTILQPDYMAISLFLPMFLAFAGLISQALNPDSKGVAALESRPILLTLLIALAAAIFVAQVSGRLTLNYNFLAWLPSQWGNKVPLLLTVLAVIGAALLSRVRLPGRYGQIGLAAVGFLWVAAVMGQVNAVWPGYWWEAYNAGSTCSERRSIFSAAIDADRILFPFVRSGKHIVIWYDIKEKDGPSKSCTILAARLGEPLFAMGYTREFPYMVVEESPDMPVSEIDRLRPGTDIVAVVSSNPAYVSRLVKRLQGHDRRWHEIGTHTVGGFDIKFDLHLIATGS